MSPTKFLKIPRVNKHQQVQPQLDTVARSTVDSAKVKEWMHSLPWSPQWDWLRTEMAEAIGETPPEIPQMSNTMADLLGILGDGENAKAETRAADDSAI